MNQRKAKLCREAMKTKGFDPKKDKALYRKLKRAYVRLK